MSYKIRFQYEGSSVNIVREYDTIPEVGTQVGLLNKPEAGNNPAMSIHEIINIEPLDDDSEADYLATTKYIETKQL